MILSDAPFSYYSPPARQTSSIRLIEALSAQFRLLSSTHSKQTVLVPSALQDPSLNVRQSSIFEHVLIDSVKKEKFELHFALPVVWVSPINFTNNYMTHIYSLPCRKAKSSSLAMNLFKIE